jgi:serine/threonine protein phosphatase 1
MRTIAIGDIHGGYKALVQLIDKIKLKDDDQLIFLGDYVDGWSQSYEVVDFLISLSRKRKQNKQTPPIYLRGNHDELVVENLQAAHPNKMWLFHGGKSTVDSYASKTKEEIEVHFDFLKNDLHNYYQLNGNGFFHAGFHNLRGPEYEYFKSITYWDRTLWEMALALDPNLKEDHDRYPNRLKLYKEIFIGHTPTHSWDAYEPMNAANVWNLDTAAAYKGPLTAMCVETKENWQSDPVYTFYPEENGRN